MNEAPPSQPEPMFLDPQEMIERSQPMARTGWLGYLTAGFFILVMLSTIASTHSPAMQAAVQFLGAVTMIGLMIGMSVFTWVIAGRQRAEQRSLESIEELLQLRRWPEAGLMLQSLLSKPTRSEMARVQGLIFLTTALARYHRYSDAILVQDYLLENVDMDPGTGYALRLGRAMAMLQEDHLTDAHQAISELRRVEGSQESAGLALIEIYRDVKTGHPAEAIDLFTAKASILRKQLGHRIADAWALVAKAYDMVGHEDAARQAYRNATLLAPIAEISRKYAEVASLTGKYLAAVAPAE